MFHIQCINEMHKLYK